MQAKPELVVLSLGVLATVLRLPNLGESLWYDEVSYSTSYWLTSLHRLGGLYLNDQSAPMYRVLLFFWIHIFGETELSVRIPPLLFGISSIVLTYWIARAYGSSRMAFLAAFLLCFSPAHVWYSQEATPYAMTLFYLLATVLAWLRLRENPSRRTWYAVYLGMFLAAVFTHYYAAAFLLPLTLANITVEKSLRRRLMVANAFVVSALALALSIKYLFGLVTTAGHGFLRPFTPLEWWMLFFNWFLQGNSLWTVNPYGANLRYLMSEPLLMVCQIFFLMIFVRGLFVRREQKNWMQAWELSLFISSLPVVMLLVTAAGYPHIYIERYLFWLLPFFFIVLARGATSFSSPRAVIACSLAVVLLGAASYGALLYKSDRWTVYKQNPDWRSTVRYLTAQGLYPHRRAMVLTTTLADDLGYYLRRDTQTPYPFVYYYDIKNSELTLAMTDVEVVYLIKNKYWAGEFDKALQQFEHDERFALVNSRSFKGVEVHTFVRSIK